MKNKTIISELTLITQFGLSLISPIFLCIFVSLKIQKYFNFGAWIVIVGIALGVGSMALNFYKFYKKHIHKKNNKYTPPQNNRHY